jgi:hypothetical protein
MNGRTLTAIICVLFAVGIFWTLVVMPRGETSKTVPKLFEVGTPIAQERVVASRPTEASQKAETPPSQPEPPPSAKKEEPAEEKTKPQTAQPVSEEPPEVVEYTPGYGRVTFTHTKHVEDYTIDCGDCHHEDMEGGMSKCINCHEPLKTALHKNCMGCHRDLKKVGKPTGPVACTECHIKKEPEPSEPPKQQEITPPEAEPPAPSEPKEPTQEKPKPEMAQPVSEEPPEVVEYTPGYGRVTFTHTKHVEDYTVDCGDCHHEDMEGGMSKCINCHEPLKTALHKTCVGCHRDLKKKGKETGPITCRDCHIKESS